MLFLTSGATLEEAKADPEFYETKRSNNMKKSLMAFTVVALLIGSACSNWNRMTPKSMDSTAIEAEIRKNLASDRITGLTVNVNNGVVTLGGHVKNTSDRQKAETDAGKVNGVTSVVDNLTIE
jgi:hypothetical protein